MKHKCLRLHIPDAANNVIPYTIYPAHVSDKTPLKAKRLRVALELCTGSLITVADKLRYARLTAGITQDELARMLGIDRATLLRYENGQVTEEHMKVELLLQAAGLCGKT